MRRPESMTPIESDFLVIGAGIAGASVAAALTAYGRVVLLEREAQPGYHSTGRSAALYLSGYGPPLVRALTLASRAFLESPPPGFAAQRLLSARGALYVAGPDQLERLEAHWKVLQSAGAAGERLTPTATCRLVPVLRPQRLGGAIHDPDSFDIDVHELHRGFLGSVRRGGGRLVCNAAVTALERQGTARWIAQAAGVEYRAAVVLNAAGAWVDELARLAGVDPLGIEPRRRTAFLFAPPPGLEVAGWPATVGVAEDWYVKPDAGMLLGSPANADATHPQDVQPEELDIALAIDRIEAMTTLEVGRPRRAWAGLRSFVADGEIVGGFDATAPGFFWVAGQGGYGIQTCAAMGEACAALAAGRSLAAAFTDRGITPSALSPARLQNRTPH